MPQGAVFAKLSKFFPIVLGVLLSLAIVFLFKDDITKYMPVKTDAKSKQETMPAQNGLPSIFDQLEQQEGENQPEKPAVGAVLYRDDKAIYTFSDTDVMLIADEIGAPKMIRYKDYLVFYGNAENGHDTVVLHNLTTGDNAIVVDMDEFGQPLLAKNYDSFEWTPELNPHILALQVIDDTAYITYGLYSSIGLVTWANLNPVLSPQLLTAEGASEILRVGGNNYLVNGGGDACFSKISFRQLDDINKRVFADEVGFSGDCVGGEHYLGFSKSRNFFVHDEYTGDGSGNTIMTSMLGAKYPDGESVELHDLTTLQTAVRSVIFDEIWDKAYLATTQTLYVYDMVTDSLVEVGDFEQELPKISLYKVLSEGGLCVSADANNAQNMLVDHTNAKVLEHESEKCKAETVTPELKYKKFADFISSLNLPENYTYQLSDAQ